MRNGEIHPSRSRVGSSDPSAPEPAPHSDPSRTAEQASVPAVGTDKRCGMGVRVLHPQSVSASPWVVAARWSVISWYGAVSVQDPRVLGTVTVLRLAR